MFIFSHLCHRDLSILFGYRSIDRLVGRLIDWLVQWSIDWLVDWSVDSLIDFELGKYFYNVSNSSFYLAVFVSSISGINF